MDNTATTFGGIPIEEARLAAERINAYMADWSDPNSPYHGARVRSLKAARGHVGLLWLAVFYRADLPNLLFRLDGQSPRLAHEVIFSSQEIYSLTQVTSDLATVQEGGEV